MINTDPWNDTQDTKIIYIHKYNTYLLYFKVLEWKVAIFSGEVAIIPFSVNLQHFHTSHIQSKMILRGAFGGHKMECLDYRVLRTLHDAGRA